ncbi:hypothetical protein T06_10867 [Trichinella sp. T6]|nr:hypothetical protein T06_10867 [Trichinella sp. T6]
MITHQQRSRYNNKKILSAIKETVIFFSIEKEISKYCNLMAYYSVILNQMTTGADLPATYMANSFIEH